VPLNQSSQEFSEKGSSGIFRLGKLRGAGASPGYDEGDPKAGRRKAYLDPTSLKLQRWNTFFVSTCLVAVFVDPLFYYLPYVDDAHACIGISAGLKKSVTVFRTITDFFYIVHMYLQFRTAFVAPSSPTPPRSPRATSEKTSGSTSSPCCPSPRSLISPNLAHSRFTIFSVFLIS
jgi:hypothetical protein